MCRNCRKWGKVADHIWYGKNGTGEQKEEKQLEVEKSAEKRKGNEVKDKERKLRNKSGKGKSFKCLRGFMCPDQYSANLNRGWCK